MMRKVERLPRPRGYRLSLLQIELGLHMVGFKKPVWAAKLLREFCPDNRFKRAAYGRALQSLYNFRLVVKFPATGGLPPTHYKVVLNENGFDVFESLRGVMESGCSDPLEGYD